jgi:DNA replication initiation complex subunit (GINS family)
MESADSNKEVALTYEMLYELMRREKNRQDLQQLDAKFFFDLVKYLSEKDLSYKEAGYKNDLFSINERDRLHTELQNIRRLVKELYERREKKIIDMALNRSRTNASIVDTTSLLPEERAFFESLVTNLDQYRNNVLGNVLGLNVPIIEGVILPTPTVAPTPAPEQTAVPEPAPSPELPPFTETNSEPEFNPENQIAESLQTEAPISNTKMVKFNQAVPEVVGMDLESYGPFEPEQTAELPPEIADILIESGEASEVIDATTPKPL